MVSNLHFLANFTFFLEILTSTLFCLFHSQTASLHWLGCPWALSWCELDWAGLSQTEFGQIKTNFCKFDWSLDWMLDQWDCSSQFWLKSREISALGEKRGRDLKKFYHVFQVVILVIEDLVCICDIRPSFCYESGDKFYRKILVRQFFFDVAVIWRIFYASRYLWNYIMTCREYVSVTSVKW